MWFVCEFCFFTVVLELQGESHQKYIFHKYKHLHKVFCNQDGETGFTELKATLGQYYGLFYINSWDKIPNKLLQWKYAGGEYLCNSVEPVPPCEGRVSLRLIMWEVKMSFRLESFMKFDETAMHLIRFLFITFILWFCQDVMGFIIDCEARDPELTQHDRCENTAWTVLTGRYVLMSPK